jgi:hypothetical protein
MTEQEYWATDPSFSDEALHALADAGDYLLGDICTDTQPRYSDYEIFVITRATDLPALASALRPAS